MKRKCFSVIASMFSKYIGQNEKKPASNIKVIDNTQLFITIEPMLYEFLSFSDRYIIHLTNKRMKIYMTNYHNRLRIWKITFEPELFRYATIKDGIDQCVKYYRLKLLKFWINMRIEVNEADNSENSIYNTIFTVNDILLNCVIDAKTYNDENKIYKLLIMLHRYPRVRQNCNINIEEFKLRSHIIPPITHDNAIDILKFIRIEDMTESLLFALNHVCNINEVINHIHGGNYTVEHYKYKTPEFKAKLWIFNIPDEHKALLSKITRLRYLIH